MKVFIITENLRKDINKMNTCANCYHQKKLHNNKNKNIVKAVEVLPIVSVQDELLNIFNQIRTLIDDQQKEIIVLQTTISELTQNIKG